MADSPHGYHFGDLTRGFVAWMGPHAMAVKGKIDWLKFAKAVVVGFVATGTLTYGAALGALAGAIQDPAWAAATPALFGLIVYVIEQSRRILQGADHDNHSFPVKPFPVNYQTLPPSSVESKTDGPQVSPQVGPQRKPEQPEQPEPGRHEVFWP